MEECNFAGKLKRKQQVNNDFSLSSPATKIRRLDTELPPIIEEEEMVSPDEVAVNEERAIVLYNNPTLQTRSPFSVSLHSDFLSGIQNPNLWSNRSHLLNYLSGRTENLNANSEQYNGSLAVVPWVPTSSQNLTTAEVEIPQNLTTAEVEIPQTQVPEMMDADDMEATTMDIEDNDSQQMLINETGLVSDSESVNQWQQQHCMIRQPPLNLSTPIAWSGTNHS